MSVVLVGSHNQESQSRSKPAADRSHKATAGEGRQAPAGEGRQSAECGRAWGGARASGRNDDR
jgi:hypothetical protein